MCRALQPSYNTSKKRACKYCCCPFWDWRLYPRLHESPSWRLSRLGKWRCDKSSWPTPIHDIVCGGAGGTSTSSEDCMLGRFSVGTHAVVWLESGLSAEPSPCSSCSQVWLFLYAAVLVGHRVASAFVRVLLPWRKNQAIAQVGWWEETSLAVERRSEDQLGGTWKAAIQPAPPLLVVCRVKFTGSFHLEN